MLYAVMFKDNLGKSKYGQWLWGVTSVLSVSPNADTHRSAAIAKLIILDSITQTQSLQVGSLSLSCFFKISVVFKVHVE